MDTAELFIWKFMLLMIMSGIIHVFFVDRLSKDEKTNSLTATILATGLCSLGTVLITGFFEWTYVVAGSIWLAIKAISAPEKKFTHYQIQESLESNADELDDEIYESEFEQYKKLRKEIEKTSMFKEWRSDVIKKFGKECVICGSKERIEIDHRYKSFYSIIIENNITTLGEAYLCKELWDINNGAPLCRPHHLETPSNVYYRKMNTADN